MLSSVGCHRTEDSPDQQWQLVQNHFYIERLPKDARDMIHQIAFVEDEGERFGARIHASQFRWLIDTFAWSRSGNEVKSLILQSKREVRSVFKAWRCQTGPFELCIEIREGDRTRKYYSKNDWVITDIDDVSALARKLVVYPASASDAALGASVELASDVEIVDAP